MTRTQPRVALLIDTNRAFEQGIIRGILRYSHLHGPWTFLCRTPVTSEGNSRITMSELKKWNPDGVIWREGNSTLPIKQLGRPVIYVPLTDKSAEFPNILTNDKQIGTMVAENFLDRGFRNFAFYGLGANYFWSLGRQTAFAEQIKTRKIETYIYDDKGRNKSRPAKQKRIATWLSSLPLPIALMICTDDCCHDCFEACRIANLRIPDDVAIIGSGNDELVCDFVDPPLSSVSWNIEHAGYEAARTLANMMAGKQLNHNPDIYVEPLNIITRRSSNILAIEDKHIAMAVQFIRNNAARRIQVKDVVKAVPASRRVLYRRFKEVLGKSILQEIRSASMDYAAKLLLESNLSISAIAVELGYDDAKNLSRMFTKEKGMTPLKYRTTYSISK